MIVMGPCEKILDPGYQEIAAVGRGVVREIQFKKKKSWLSESRLWRDADIDNGKI